MFIYETVRNCTWNRRRRAKKIIIAVETVFCLHMLCNASMKAWNEQHIYKSLEWYTVASTRLYVLADKAGTGTGTKRFQATTTTTTDPPTTTKIVMPNRFFAVPDCQHINVAYMLHPSNSANSFGCVHHFLCRQSFQSAVHQIPNSHNASHFNAIIIHHVAVDPAQKVGRAVFRLKNGDERGSSWVFVINVEVDVVHRRLRSWVDVFFLKKDSEFVQISTMEIF